MNGSTILNSDSQKPDLSITIAKHSKASKRTICNCLKKESFIKLKTGCVRCVDILDRGCSICFVLTVNLVALLFFIFATYALVALKSSSTLEELFDAFGLGMLLKK